MGDQTVKAEIDSKRRENEHAEQAYPEPSPRKWKSARNARDVRKSDEEDVRQLESFFGLCHYP